MNKINVLSTEIGFYNKNEEDYICITDIAKYKDSEKADHIIQNWIRNRNTIEFLGIWEQLNNSNFKPLEFDGFRKQALSILFISFFSQRILINNSVQLPNYAFN